jgi:hypothetical protein
MASPAGTIGHMAQALIAGALQALACPITRTRLPDVIVGKAPARAVPLLIRPPGMAMVTATTVTGGQTGMSNEIQRHQGSTRHG